MILQNYKLSEGHIQGMAEACENLDHQKINRMLFNNCGLTGENLATILEGIALMQDFKSLTYMKGGINAQAIENLAPILLKRVPNHLEELNIIDCKISPSGIV